jgi:cytoskeletal protein CcmA (bactofilin family)
MRDRATGRRRPMMRERLDAAESRRRLVVFAAAVVVLLVFSLAARTLVARPTIGLGHLVVQGDYMLDGPHLGDLVVVAQNVNITGRAAVTGNLSILGSSIVIEGTVGGALTVVGESVQVGETGVIAHDAAILGETAVFAGAAARDLRLTGARAEIAETARVGGRVFACVDAYTNASTSVAGESASSQAACSDAERFAPFAALIALRDQGLLAPVSESTTASRLLVLSVFGLVFAGLAALLTAAAPELSRRVLRVARRGRGALWAAGLAVYALWIGAAALTVLLLAWVPLLGFIAVALLLGLTVWAAALFAVGWSAAAGWLGGRIMRGIRPGRTRPLVSRGAPAIEAALGTLILVVAFMALLLVPFGGRIAVLVLVFTSLPLMGAALLALRATFVPPLAGPPLSAAGVGRAERRSA